MICLIKDEIEEIVRESEWKIEIEYWVCLADIHSFLRAPDDICNIQIE